MRGDSARSPISPPSRSPSVSSLSSPTGIRFSLCQPPHVGLSPSYVAPAAASEIIAGLHVPSGRDVNDPVYERAAVMSDEALALVNTFLDFLLFNVLTASRSSALDAVRHAVEYIVKGKLGQLAVQSGEYELEELINDEDESELASMQYTPDAESQWDADAVWKRTRLKIFTYMRLSEIEDEEEDDFLEEEVMTDGQVAPHRLSQHAKLVSWPAMIFLTGVLERIAEQCIKDAGESAYSRASMSRPGTREGRYSDEEDMILVSDQDVKKLALSQLVGRLWRTWKHTIPRGSPRLSGSPWKSSNHERRNSAVSDVAIASQRTSTALEPITDEARAEEARQEPIINVSSPKSLRPTSDQTSTRPKQSRHAPRRSRSFGRFPVVIPSRADVGSWQSQMPRAEVAYNEKRLSRARSSSLPPPTIETANLVAPNAANDEPTSASAAMPATKEKRNSRNARDIAADAARASPQVAEAAVVYGPSKRQSRGSQKRRSGEVRRSREMTAGVQGTASEQVQHHTLQVPTAPALTGRSDDEYDPFRADASNPSSVQSPKPAANSSTVPPPQGQETLRGMSQQDSTDISPHRDPGATATLADGAVSTAMFGSTTSRKSKKPAPLDMSVANVPSARAQRREVIPQARSLDTHETGAKDTSPAQASAGRADESRTPSSSKLQRLGTSDTSSAPYHTPRDSPVRDEDRASTQQRSSDPAYSVAPTKPLSPKFKRGPADSTTQRTLNKGGDAAWENDKLSRMSTRSDKEFNDLMSGTETVKRSLTPKTLIDIEVSLHHKHLVSLSRLLTAMQAIDSPTLRQQQVKPTYEPPSPPMASRHAEYELWEPAGSSENTSKKASNIGALRQAAEARVAQIGSPASPSKSTRQAISPRDARGGEYQTNDIVDFIRSTAPTRNTPAPLSVAPKVPNGKVPVSQSSPAAHPRSPAAYQQPSVKSVVPNTSRAAGKKQLRPARMERQANDDLISFLNDGPPGAYVSKSRSMETTGSHAGEGLGLGTLSPANRSSSQMSQSINESINSHSGLLSKGAANAQPERSPLMNVTTQRTQGMPKVLGGEGGAPMRKQRRVKDPYAIDSDDEDEDVLTGLPQKDEPSDSMGLVDFLKSTAPPEDNLPNGPARSRMASPPGSRGHMGTSSTAVGSPTVPHRPVHKPIPSNEEIKRDPGDYALPHFLKEDRHLKPRESSDSESGLRKGRPSSKSSEAGRGGMRGLFKKIGVNG